MTLAGIEPATFRFLVQYILAAVVETVNVINAYKNVVGKTLINSKYLCVNMSIILK